MPEPTEATKPKIDQGVIYKFLYLILRQMGKTLAVDMKAIENFPPNANITIIVEDGKLMMFVPKKRNRKIVIPTRKILKPN